MTSDIASKIEELEKLRRENEQLRARLCFETRQNKEDLDYTRTQCQRKLDFEREQAEAAKLSLEKRLLALVAEKDGHNQELRKTVEQLENDRRQLEHETHRLQDEHDSLQEIYIKLKENAAAMLNQEFRLCSETDRKDQPSRGSSASVPNASKSQGPETALSLEVCRTAIAHLQNPKISNAAFHLAPNILYSRLQPSGFAVFPIEAHSSIVDQQSSRDFEQVAKSGLARSGYRRYIYANKRYWGPFVPLKPGAPGLICSLSDQSFQQQSGTPFFSSDPGSDEWNYMGNYEFKKSTQLSAEEFKQLPTNYRQVWAHQVLHNDKLIPVLSRIVLHQLLGRIPTDGEILGHMEILKERRESSKGMMNLIFQDGVTSAFLNGFQKVNVWTMKCVGYDEYLKRALLGNPPKPVNSPEKRPADSAASDAQNHTNTSESCQHAREEYPSKSDADNEPPKKKVRLENDTEGNREK